MSERILWSDDVGYLLGIAGGWRLGSLPGIQEKQESQDEAAT